MNSEDSKGIVQKTIPGWFFIFVVILKCLIIFIVQYFTIGCSKLNMMVKLV